MTDNERHIVISADLEALPGTIRVDLGSLAPHVAYSILQHALESLEYTAGPNMVITHQGQNVPSNEAADDSS
jgi:hypothetical protein